MLDRRKTGWRVGWQVDFTGVGSLKSRRTPLEGGLRGDTQEREREEEEEEEDTERREGGRRGGGKGKERESTYVGKGGGSCFMSKIVRPPQSMCIVPSLMAKMQHPPCG